MADSRALFSESWHRVASQRIRLRPSVRIRKQYYRGERWHVVQDPFTNSFFRFSAEAHEFIARLDGSRTVEEIWRHCLELNRERAPGQGEVIQMLAQLYQTNLIVSDVPPDTQRLFERQRKFKQQELRSRFLNVFFLRLRLWDPDAFLRRTLPYVSWAFTRWAGLAWLVVVGVGLSAAFGDWDRLRSQSAGVLEPGNLLVLYFSFALAKLVHEFGHAYTCRKFGGEVHAMGITLLVFTLVPFVDASSAWAFRERRRRVLVGLAGMIPELFLAAIAALIWANTGTGLLNGVCYNLMLVASVSTVLFNANPLLRFDGYYVLSDLTDTPNLMQRAQQQLLHVVEGRVFGGRHSVAPARSRREGVLLVIYAIASWIYRLIITWSLIMLVADQYFGAGFAAAMVAFFGTFVLPVFGAVRYLVKEPRIERVRLRAAFISTAAAVAVIILIGAVPFPHRFRVPGILQAENSSKVIAATAGYVDSVSVQSRTQVIGNQPLVKLVNPELDLQIASAGAELEATRALERKVLRETPSRIAAVRRRIESVERQFNQLQEDKAALQLRSRQEGMWISPRAEDYAGLWVPRGTAVGEVIDDRTFEFLAIVPQQEARELFGRDIAGAEVRFPGEAGHVVRVKSWRVVPGRQDTLPSPALGWAGGGPVRVSQDDSRGVHAAEPFFLVVAKVEKEPAVAMLNDRTGVMRFSLPNKPLLAQWIQSFRQLLQERYHL